MKRVQRNLKLLINPKKKIHQPNRHGEISDIAGWSSMANSIRSWHMLWDDFSETAVLKSEVCVEDTLACFHTAPNLLTMNKDTKIVPWK